ncbi:hypothetical protein OBV_20480 [Oscillibacter valericigenes Sjm18-20]|nr:hypothetical protein OBV_20480 [Oscillibacter valericigenes Sjm18-20]
MKEVLDFLKSCGTFYLATSDGDQPRVRPFGAVCEFEGKLYLVTNNRKKVYAQMLNNPKVEICGMNKGTWLRIAGKAIHDDRRQARQAMMDANSAVLSSMYAVDDNLMEVLYLEDVTATFYSFTSEPRTVKF